MTITVHSDFWGNNYSMINDKPSIRKKIARILNQYQSRGDRELIKTLLGVVPGSAAQDGVKRVAHDTQELGGLRTIEMDYFVNRNTTAGDVTDISNKILTYASRPTYPVDTATLY